MSSFTYKGSLTMTMNRYDEAFGSINSTIPDSNLNPGSALNTNA